MFVARSFALVLLAASTALGQESAPAESAPGATGEVEITSDMLLPMNLAAAREYEIYADADRSKKLVLRETPITTWINLRRAGGQFGHVFLWMDGDRPAAMGALFSFPWGGDAEQRRMVHELHALSPDKLVIDRNGASAKWQPSEGLRRLAIPGVNAPITTQTRFRVQAQQISRRFSGHCIDGESKRWPLRVLSPMLVYPINDNGEQGFGALIGMMGDIGTDLESGLLIEAMRGTGKSAVNWRFAPIRMTDMETHLSFGDNQVWQSVRTDEDTRFHDAAHTYFRFQDRTIPLSAATDSP